MKLLTFEFTFTGYARTLEHFISFQVLHQLLEKDTHSFPFLVKQQPQNRAAG